MFRSLLVICLWSLLVPMREAHAVTPFVRVTPQYLKDNPDFIQITHTDRGQRAEFEVRLRLAKPERIATGIRFKGREEDQVVFPSNDTLANNEARVRFVIPKKSAQNAVFTMGVGGMKVTGNETEPGGSGETVYEFELHDFVTPLAQEAQAPAVDTHESRVALLRGKNLPPATRNDAKCFVLLDEQRLSQSLDDEPYWDALRAQFTHDERLTVHFRISAVSGRDVPVKALSARIKKELASADAFVVCVDHETRKNGESWEQRVLELNQMQRTLSRKMRSPDGLLWVEYDPANAVSWRALTEQKKYREAAQVIEQFLADNPKFETEEVLAAASMHFDAAQNRALDGNTDAALRHIKAARHNQPTGDGVLWNEYLDGTEAFLRNDRAALLVALKKVCAGGPINRPNAAFLDKLSVHFGETYEQAYLAWRNAPPPK